MPTGLGYDVNVTEDVAVGTVLLRVRATDADEGPNGDVVYRFSALTQSTYGGLFGVDNQTGEISVRGTLDHERHSVYGCFCFVVLHRFLPACNRLRVWACCNIVLQIGFSS